MFDVAAGFVYAQVLFAVVELDLLALLLEEPRSIAALAERFDLPERSVHSLLVAAEGIGLVERRGSLWGLARRGAAVAGNPGLVAMVRHHDMLYRDLLDPIALLRAGKGTHLPAFWPYADGSKDAIDPSSVARYSALMAASQGFVAHEVLAAYPFARHRRLLDVGGGEGVFAVAAARRHPGLCVGVFDLPAVADRARAHFAKEGLDDRAVAVGGDLFAEDLPRDADVVTLVRVIHDHEDDAALAILTRVADALPSGGKVVVAEPMAGSGAAPGIAPYFAMYLLAMGSGRPRRPDEIASLLTRAGFVRPRRRKDRNPTAVRVIEATRA